MNVYIFWTTDSSFLFKKIKSYNSVPSNQQYGAEFFLRS